MKKIGICILHPWYISSWFDTNIIWELAAESAVEIFAPAEVIRLCNNKEIKSKSISFVQIEVPPAKIVSRAYFFVAMVLMRKRNSSFRIRLKYLIFGEVKLFPVGLGFKNALTGLYLNIKYFLKYCRHYFYQLLAYIPIIDTVIFNLLKILYNRSSTNLPEQMRKKLDLVIFVGGNIEIEIFEMIKSLNRIGQTSALCIENWDNLTSKRFIITIPNYIFVMGNDSAELASSIQGIQREKIIVAGLPRFNPYRNQDKVLNYRSQDTFNILYLGCYQPHNEIKLINMLVDKLNNSEIAGRFKLIYKPHPGARNRYGDDLALHGPIEVVRSNSRANPTIDLKHTSVIHESNIVVSTPTSMLIECMLLGKKIILDLTSDGVHRSTAGLAYKNYVHFEILNKIDNLIKCFKLDQLVESIILEYKTPTIKSIQYNLTDLIEINSPSYSAHILKVLNSL